MWRLNLHAVETNYLEILEICDGVEDEEHLEVFGPQIELSLENSSDMGEPAVEVAEVPPTTVVEVEEKSSVEVLEASASVEKVGDQAVRTVDETAHGTMDERTGAEPVLMDMDEVRTGVEPVLETVEKKLGEQAVRTGDEPVPEVEELRIGKELVPADVEMGTRDMHVHEMEVSDSHYEDF